MTSSLSSSAPNDALERLADLEQLDQPAGVVGKAIRDGIPRGPIKDALSGTWLGHAVHPLLTDLPIGAWTSAVLLDWLGGHAGQKGADRLIALGIAFVPATAATGAT